MYLKYIISNEKIHFNIPIMIAVWSYTVIVTSKIEYAFFQRELYFQYITNNEFTNVIVICN